MEVSESPARRALVELTSISKNYPGVQALNSISLDFREGEVHAVVGENGAGKSTLVRLLVGLERPDAEGSFVIDGRSVRLRDPRDARHRGISFVPQETEGIDTFSVGRSVLLGRERFRTSRSRLSFDERTAVIDTLERVGVADVEPEAPLASLSVAQRRLCQIAATLVAPGKLLVLDEPTAVLSDADAELLLVKIEQLRAQGVSILYISHRLNEVLRLSDRITVLRDGCVVGTFARGDIDRQGLLDLMARVQEVTPPDRLAVPANSSTSRAVRLRVRDASLSKSFDGIDLDVAAGQIVGIAGIQGSGHGRLLDALAGACPLDRGEITVDGMSVVSGHLHDALRAGIQLVPEDRRDRGVIGVRSLRENLGIGYGSSAQSRFRRRHSTERGEAERAIATLHIRASDCEVLVGNLSGGNQQKTVIARALASSPSILLLCEPTQGIDVGSKAEILGLLRSTAQSHGVGIVLASSEFEELLDYTDVLHVMRTGQFVATLLTAQTSYREVLDLAVP